MIVIDTSAMGPLVLPDEAASLSPEAANRLFDSPLIVPHHWRLEMANMLRTATRRQRIDQQQRDAILRRLTTLDVTIDQAGQDLVWTAVLELSDRHGLTPYDAAYLELAQRRSASLATLDRQLAAAARQQAVALVLDS